MIRRKFFNQKLTLWVFVLTCAVAMVSLAQARMLCELGEVSSGAIQADQDSSSESNRSHDHGSHSHSHGGEHKHAQSSTAEDGQVSENSSDSSEEECCDEIGPTSFVSITPKTTYATLGFLVHSSLRADLVAMNSLVEGNGSRAIPRGSTSIPPPLSLHISSTVLRI